MDEHVKTEQYLSEEQLQAITGGCQECNRDKVAIWNHERSAQLHEQLGQLAEASGQVDKSHFHMEKLFFHGGKALEAKDRIAEREETPGHVVLPDPQLLPARRGVM